VTVTASAPGKIVLSGEYAVLDGAPAIAMAVDRRAVASVSDNTNDECRVVTEGFESSGDARYRIVEAVCGARPAGRDFVLDTRAFVADGRKLGIGSSAALTVALVAALQQGRDIFHDALRAHRRFQGGAGSGVDVAAAVAGGLIEYRMQDCRVERLDWPEGLVVRVIGTGVPASTRDKLARLSAARAKPSRGALVLAAEHITDAWRSGSAAEVLAVYPRYIAALRQFSVDHDLGIFDAGHEQLAVAAEAAGLVYKPAGAGGGDIGVLFGNAEQDVASFIAGNEKAVHSLVPCALDPRGVVVEHA
jgi:phosphomevalonate kinase